MQSAKIFLKPIEFLNKHKSLRLQLSKNILLDFVFNTLLTILEKSIENKNANTN
ncbi:hypothetical protein HMPREF0765_0703 [Sphingobacterium spiritivorum ATCC 33300]|uniref:Uncharacterized protein n=1 Tax=Sphingobacterium spiritivorum ATCC 33300 TaxID=525372 RepID=C2FTS1_SPHSI|nr:hypothetical protein HMPREF0765_0703 [Sphingobacterium spiritivorum ATCC 33300]